jgi:hypothetical protein
LIPIDQIALTSSSKAAGSVDAELVIRDHDLWPALWSGIMTSTQRRVAANGAACGHRGFGQSLALSVMDG